MPFSLSSLHLRFGIVLVGGKQPFLSFQNAPKRLSSVAGCVRFCASFSAAFSATAELQNGQTHTHTPHVRIFENFPPHCTATAEGKRFRVYLRRPSWQAASAIAGRCSTALGVPGPTTMMMMRRFSWISSVRVGTAGCAQSRARRTEA